MTPHQHRQHYASERVLTASPIELVRILYETAVQAVDEALAALHNGDIAARGDAITKAIEVISELRFSLRREVSPQYCDTLSGLYDYMQRQLLRAHSEKSGNVLQEVSRLLQTLLEGWSGAMQNLSATTPDRAPVAPVEESAPAASPSNPYSAGVSAMERNRSWQL
jgi:flagellar secretion chaperone FliS